MIMLEDSKQLQAVFVRHFQDLLPDGNVRQGRNP